MRNVLWPSIEPYFGFVLLPNAGQTIQVYEPAVIRNLLPPYDQRLCSFSCVLDGQRLRIFRPLR